MDMQLHHLDKLKGRAPQKQNLLQYSLQNQTTEVFPTLPKKTPLPKGPLGFLLPPFFLFLFLSIGLIWFLPFEIDWMYRAVTTVICLLFSISLISSIDMMVRRWNTPASLMTQKVPALPRDPLRTLTRDLEQDTDMFLKRLPK